MNELEPAKIKLTKGYESLVDQEDFEMLNKHKWNAGISYGLIYARRSDRSSGKLKTIKIHRVVMGITDSKIFIDHIDGNTLNNQKSNLRLCTHAQNMQNKKCKNKNGFKGIVLSKDKKFFYAKIRHNKKDIHLGSFKSPEDAARAYDKKALEIFGDFAKINFPINKILDKLK